jgi:hypothetical protein
MKANLILPRSAACQITSWTDVASWDAFTAHRSSLGLTTWCHDAVCCSGFTEYNGAGTLQWSTSGTSCKNVAIFILQFLDSRGIDVGETPNDITLHGFNNETTFAPCDTTVQSGKILHAWNKFFFKNANKGTIDQNEMGYNDVQTVNY